MIERTHRGRGGSGWSVVPLFAGGMVLVMGLAQIGFRMSHDARKRRLKREGVLVEAILKKKAHVSYRDHLGPGNSSHRRIEHWWIKYLPDGKKDTKENLVWEDVSEPDFKKFAEGQKIHAWMLNDEHYIRERSGFHSDIPDWGFLLAAVSLIAAGIAGKRIGRKMKEARR